MDTNTNTGSGRASYSEEDRRELIDEFQSSGLTQAAFCREWNINPKTFARWLRVERKQNDIAFCEVEVPEGPEPTVQIQVRMPNQVTVVLPASPGFEIGAILREAFRCSD